MSEIEKNETREKVPKRKGNQEVEKESCVET